MRRQIIGLLVLAAIAAAAAFLSSPGYASEPPPAVPGTLEVVLTDSASVQAFLEALNFKRTPAKCRAPGIFLGPFFYPGRPALTICMGMLPPTPEDGVSLCNIAQVITGHPYAMRMEPGTSRVTCIPGSAS